jgi:hypothetical protein
MGSAEGAEATLRPPRAQTPLPWQVSGRKVRGRKGVGEGMCVGVKSSGRGWQVSGAGRDLFGRAAPLGPDTAVDL